MLKKSLSIFFIIFIFSFVPAQEFQIKGKLIDSGTKSPLEAATVYLETSNDSTLITYSISEGNGSFLLDGKTNYRNVVIFFSYNGYELLKKDIVLKKNIDLGVISLDEKAQELKGIDVVGERVPITIKKDTLEFNADSFKTRPDATVEEVLKKLPGVEIDSDGKITVNGKEVDKVLVNGQVFFSNDPKVATKSLPKELISKIQILDSKTKEQEFTGDAGDGKTKTINLTLKEDKTNGFMGRLSAGYGQDDRYQANGLLNYFNKTKRVSFLGSSNNINNSGFSFDEVYEMVGNSRGGGVSFNNSGAFSIGDLSFGFGQGITTSSNLGGSYANKKEKEYEVDANYFFSYSDSYNNEKTSRENLLPDNRFFTDMESSFSGTTNSNQGAANLQFDLDETLRITAQPSMSVSRTTSLDFSRTVNSNEDAELINTNISQQTNDGFQRNFSNQLEVMKKLDTIGRYFRVTFKNTNVAGNTVSNLGSESKIFGDNPTQNNLDQETRVNNTNDRYEIGAGYRQPLAKNVFLDFEYSFEDRVQKNERSVFQLDDNTMQYSIFDQSLSSDFEFETQEQIPSLEFRTDGKKLRFRLKAEYNTVDLKNQDRLQQVSFSKGYGKVLFNSNVSYNFGQNTRFWLSYDSDLNIPSVNQIQPIPNVTNPLNIIVGKPDLLPAINHSVYFNFNNFNWKDREGFFIYAGFNFNENQIVNATDTDENLVRTTTYDNVNGSYNHYGAVNYSKQIKKDSIYTLKLNLRPYVNLQKNIGFTNGLRLEAKQLSVSPRIGLTFNYKEKFEIEPEYTYSVNTTKYNLGTRQDINFISQKLSFKTTTYWPKNLIWGNDITYSFNGNVGPGFDKDAIFWNMSLGLQVFKNKGSIKLLGYDLLNQNINTRRTTGQDFVQDYQGTVLKRYFMASFTLKFDSFGGSGPPEKKGSRFMRL
ncbi:outer membrane beta-barrel protein [Maribacter sp. X9]|uniref:outer membrane beta-barrel protein n=1 Tax=Maribacter sp. X9 TaxID=3402159 RepID=UPI003AF3736D